MAKKAAAAPKAVQSAPAPTAAPSKPSTPPSPLPIAHYIPRLPLQLVAVLFCLFAAASQVITDEDIIGPARLIAALTLNPLGTLPLACGLLALVQTWFGYWLRSCRTAAAKKEAGVEEDKPVKEKKGIKGSFGDMWTKALGGEAPHKTLWKRAQKKKPGDALGGFDTRFVPQAVMVTLAATFAFFVCAVLLGAPLFSNVTETFLLCLFVSILSVLPLSIAIPPLNSAQEQYTWLRLFSSLSPNDDLELALLAPAVGAIAGCWSGAIPIPLDWDRPWQKWPTTCVLGALSGHMLGSIVSLAICAYRGAVRGAASVLQEVKEQEQAKSTAAAGKGGRKGKAQ
ncbi:hypothetical protein JCM10207_007907 [Rhodosporidiobolus poonsookiae]